MSKKFLTGTELYAYECMMQGLPDVVQSDKSDKRMKRQYIGLLKQFMREYGFQEICERVLRILDELLFDEFIFLNTMHRDTFWHMYGRFIKSTNKKDNRKTAVIYLLSTNEVFKIILANYVSNPLFALPSIAKGCNDEESYNIYQAVKIMAGMESGLYDEDLFEEGLIDNKVLCLIMIAKMIEKYGITGWHDRQDRKSRPQYTNKPVNQGKRQNTYVYNGRMIRIK